jgi:hypothetical protein
VGFYGADVFSYVARDLGGLVSLATTVSIDVTPPACRPLTQIDSILGSARAGSASIVIHLQSASIKGRGRLWTGYASVVDPSSRLEVKTIAITRRPDAVVSDPTVCRGAIIDLDAFGVLGGNRLAGRLKVSVNDSAPAAGDAVKVAFRTYTKTFITSSGRLTVNGTTG